MITNWTLSSKVLDHETSSNFKNKSKRYLGHLAMITTFTIKMLVSKIIKDYDHLRKL